MAENAEAMQMVRQPLDLSAWIEQELNLKVDGWQNLAGDASGRRYFRLWTQDRSWIAMLAPPPENPKAFVAVAELLRGAGVRVPAVYARNLERGWLLLEDFGDLTCFQALRAGWREELYRAALAQLTRLQSLDPQTVELPRYDEGLLRRELEIFRTWLAEAWLELAVPEAVWGEAVEVLVDSALAQPVVAVHRDFHSRNLMVLAEGGVGVLDFQDAVVGPATYDLVSLLRDCYLAWPKETVSRWCEGYRLQLAKQGIDVSPQTWRKWFDRMGAQRHLKAAGIFARLWLRDGKGGYLKDIPRTLGYVVEVAGQDAELKALGEFLADRVLPQVLRRLAR
ncbi:aminoglycoside phosphotransferase family protein [Methylothermus subterraneus]